MSAEAPVFDSDGSLATDAFIRAIRKRLLKMDLIGDNPKAVDVAASWLGVITLLHASCLRDV